MAEVTSTSDTTVIVLSNDEAVALAKILASPTDAPTAVLLAELREAFGVTVDAPVTE